MSESPRPQTPAEAWRAMADGNRRFVSGAPAHPRQDIDRREQLAGQQKPFAALFGCSDSRLSAEIIFDVGLGDLFVVRNAGQIIAETILGSLEYSVEVLGVPLILVLGHDECGAIRATIDATEGKLQAKGDFIHNLVERIRPTVEAANQQGLHHIDAVTDLHIKDTINELLTRSKLIAEAVKSGKVAIVGANYTLSRGEISPIITIGELN
ncbi:carbonic anhydrase [Rhodoluna limnophila]|uniref:carbonic anhydrase n=1 Tax=Rhodoluna limnophila TaxID=232537 RepID=UPI001106E3AB|nr:carbonic anhydrase [Rhodoluna limnophila]